MCVTVIWLLFFLNFLTKSQPYRTSACLNNNEEFSLCAPVCPPTCINIRLIKHDELWCPSRWECRIGCRCSSGFLRDDYTNDCVAPHQCPKTKCGYFHFTCAYEVAGDSCGTMKVAATSCVLIASVLLINAAPTPETKPVPEDTLLELQRVKRSNYGPAPYGAPSYVVPQCGAAAPAPYHMNIAPHAPAYGYPAHALPSPYAGYGIPHYRTEDFAEDLETFNEMEHGDHFAKMRSYGGYDGAAAAAAAAGSGHITLSHLNAPVAVGPALGLFPGANTGGCNVPLLLSCSPSVVPGRLVKSGAHYAVAPAAPAPAIHYSAPAAAAPAPIPAYRGAESMNDNQEEQHVEPATHDHHESNIHDTSRINSGSKHN